MDQFVRVYFKLCAFFLEREREGKARKINGGTEATLFAQRRKGRKCRERYVSHVTRENA